MNACCPFLLTALPMWQLRKPLTWSACALPHRTMGWGDTASTIALLGDLRLSHASLSAKFVLFFFDKLL